MLASPAIDEVVRVARGATAGTYFPTRGVRGVVRFREIGLRAERHGAVRLKVWRLVGNDGGFDVDGTVRLEMEAR